MDDAFPTPTPAPQPLAPQPLTPQSPGADALGISLADIVSDLENRVHVREAQERTALYASVLNNVPIQIAVLGADHRYLYCNPESIKNGAIRAWIIGKNDFEYCEYRGFSVEIAQKRWARFEEAVEKRGAVSWEETFVDPQGNTRHHWRNMMPLFSPAGELEAVLGYGRDITERKRVRDELERSSRRVVNILESVSDTFFFLDTAWRFTYVNGKAEKFFGRPRGELLGENVWETFPQLLDYRFHQECLGAAAQARPVTLEEYHPPTDRWFETRFYPAEEGVAVYLRNVSDRRALERTRREAQRELERQVHERTAALEKARAELERANEKLLHDAFHDELTGLANRALFMDRLGVAIERNKRGGKGGFAVLFLDFDRFKLVNDSLGHTVGDALLVELSKRLRGCVRPSDTVARLGGDEFTILLEVDGLEGAVRTADRVQKALSAPFILAGHTLHSSASIGIVSCEIGHSRPEDVLRDADIAMYRAKALGRAGYQIFTREMRARAASLLTLENDLRVALREGELEVHYQPIVSVETGLPVGFEALTRWTHPTHGFVSPAEFIPIAEEAGLIVELDRWVLREACGQVKGWQDAFPALPPLSLSVNVSGQGFARADLAERVSDILQDTGFDPRSLKLELTESVLMGSTNANFEKLKALGIALHIDDFGTGYSSLSYLQRFPVDMLKIDRSFVQAMAERPESAELVRTITVMAKNLNLKVTAEGIETAEQLAHLKALGCEYGQGYLFAKPLSAVAATTFITEKAEVGK